MLSLRVVKHLKLIFKQLCCSFQKVPCNITPAKIFFENGGLLRYSLVPQIFDFDFGTCVRSLPNALRIVTPKKSLSGAGGGFLSRFSKSKLNSFGHRKMWPQFSRTESSLVHNGQQLIRSAMKPSFSTEIKQASSLLYRVRNMRLFSRTEMCASKFWSFYWLLLVRILGSEAKHIQVLGSILLLTWHFSVYICIRLYRKFYCKLNGMSRIFIPI